MDSGTDMVDWVVEFGEMLVTNSNNKSDVILFSKYFQGEKKRRSRKGEDTQGYGL